MARPVVELQGSLRILYQREATGAVEELIVEAIWYLEDLSSSLRGIKAALQSLEGFMPSLVAFKDPEGAKEEANSLLEASEGYYSSLAQEIEVAVAMTQSALERQKFMSRQVNSLPPPPIPSLPRPQSFFPPPPPSPSPPLTPPPSNLTPSHLLCTRRPPPAPSSPPPPSTTT